MSRTKHPRRIVALGTESADLLQRLGAWSRVVGVTGYFRQPKGVRPVPKISGFDTAHVEKIAALKPDIVITYSDVQAEIAAELIRRGLTVLATNQRTLAETAETMRWIGRVVGCEARAEKWVRAWEKALRPVRREKNPARVYFEEWPEPMVCGIAWVSELIEAASGIDIFADRRPCRASRERGVTTAEIVARKPDIIIASWCGKKANLAQMASRPGWESVPAVRTGRIYELDSDVILSPGPALMEGFRRLRKIISARDGSNRE